METTRHGRQSYLFDHQARRNVRRNLTGAVTKMLEDAGLRVVASKRIHMTKAQAEGFYAVHKERPFFNDLVAFMTSGPVVVQVLEGENAVQRNRDIMGATNSENAVIRKTARRIGIEANSVHGSDSDENAADRNRLFLQAGRNCRLILPWRAALPMRQGRQSGPISGLHSGWK